MMFLPQAEADAQKAQSLLEVQAAAKGFVFLGWRDPPQNKDVLGPLARAALPRIRQAFLHHPTLRGDALEAALYQVRRSTQAEVLDKCGKRVGGAQTYFCSLSSRTIIYKGMVMSAVLGPFYGDLTNPAFHTNFAVYHRRFSTNTNPKWPLAQPMRCLAHNGEINTLIGNVNWQRALDIQRNPLLDCNRNGVLDMADLLDHPEWDCNGNARVDTCDFAEGAPDDNLDGHLDSCSYAKGDFDLDGEVTTADLSVALLYIGEVDSPVGDLDGDGTVTTADVSLLLLNFGPVTWP
jgi:glutamate synthase domain-containing protein 1